MLIIYNVKNDWRSLMLLDRIRELELEKLFAYQGDDYQRKMAAALRQLTFDYLEGKLKSKIPDGPSVVALRKDLNIIGGMAAFIRTQKPNGAWATDIELTLLSELMGVNFKVAYGDRIDRSTGKPLISCLSTTDDPNRPTVTIKNTNSTHWDTGRGTIHDGNCGYNAYALEIESIARPLLRRSPVVNKPIHDTKSHINKPAKQIPSTQSTTQITQTLPPTKIKQDKTLEEIVIEEQKAALAAIVKQPSNTYQPSTEIVNTNESWVKVYNSYSDELQKQYDADRLYALRLAIQDLPGIQGKASTNSSKEISTEETTTHTKNLLRR